MIEVTADISIAEEALQWRAARASGPGGQHVNKTSTAIELRFDAMACPTLPTQMKQRLAELAGSRINSEGVIVIFAQTHRSQELNRQDALSRLIELLRLAAVRPKRRRATKPTFASKVKRLDGKARRSGVKTLRGRVGRED